MQGTMMTEALTIGALLDHAARWHGDARIVSVETDGDRSRTDWRSTARNARRLGAELADLGIETGDRCGTIAWNNRRHLEVYFGVSGRGFVTHTINPRLSPENLIYVITHARDRVLFFDATFLPAVVKLRPKLETVEHFVLMGPRDAAAAEAIPGLLFQDDLIAQGADAPFPAVDETAPSSLCYTSGTTGRPKGVLYTHRSTVLHTLAGNSGDGLNIKAVDAVLPVVPMFHVSAWGVPYMAAATGATLVLPGPKLDGESLAALIADEAVTLAFGVPTIWMGLLAALRSSGRSVPSLTRTIVGGSAMPPSMIAEFAERGVEAIHAWGITETSPLGTIARPLAGETSLSEEERAARIKSQGRVPFGVNLRIVDEAGIAQPHDGSAQGSLQIKGHWIVDTYDGADETALTADGWFDTGDVATVSPQGFVVIRDRTKDMVKSGGEWISTVELENIAIAHPGIANVAVIAAAHPKWAERPVLIAVAAGEDAASEADLLATYTGKVPDWQIPDRAIFLDELPLGATGKVLKARLRESFGSILLENAEEPLLAG